MSDADTTATRGVLLSVIMPAYNERDRIGPTLESVRAYLGRSGMSAEVLVVDDGSTDGTAELVEHGEWTPLNVRVLRQDRNRGKGFAVRQGMLAAQGDNLLLYDADQSAPIEELERLRPWLDRGYDVVIGSRDLPDSVLDPPQPRWRRCLAAVFRGLRRAVLLPELRDTQCGFKLFRRAAARAVFARQTINGWTFDCEVLGLADRLGYRIKEVGIIWRNHPASRVKPLRLALPALLSLGVIRWRLGRIRRGDD